MGWLPHRSDLVDRTLQFYAKLYLQDDILTKVDRASMMHSPGSSRAVSRYRAGRFRAAHPVQYKLRRADQVPPEKGARTRAAERHSLPVEEGLRRPIGAWFKNGTLQMNGNRTSQLQNHFIREKTAAHLAGRSDERAFLWNTYVLNRWSASQHALA